MSCRFWLVPIVLIATSAYGQDDDEEQPPGLLARYEVGQAVIERVDPDIAFQWADALPDERLPAGKFTANWSGTLLLRSADKYRFHAFVQGKVSLKVDDHIVLEGSSDEPQWISGPETELTFGDQPLELNYSRTGGAGELKLYWSSDEFPLEPVPHHALFQAKPSPQLTLIDRGRIQFDAFRCASCHRVADPQWRDRERLPAPSLDHVGIGTKREWLIQKLMHSGEAKVPWQAASKMPQFGFNREEAEAIVAALQARAVPLQLIAAARPKDSERAKDLQAGQTLVRSVGCVACHAWKSLGETTPFGGGSLDDLAERRTSDWVTTWLADPARLNADHRMPLVALTDKERSQVVLALTESSVSGFTENGKSTASDDIVARGTKLIESARCSNCHDIPAMKSDLQLYAPLAETRVDWSKSCASSFDRAKSRPGFAQVDAKAIQAYLASWRTSSDGRVTSGQSQGTLAGRRVLERKNCLSCHDRDAVKGISNHAAAIARSDESLAGLHMTLIPPRLNAVGDRMQDLSLVEAIRGEQKLPRLPWLRVRMPKFAHLPADQAALLKHLIGHDRIPEGGPTKSAIPNELAGKRGDPQQILAGRELLGGKGFSCVACHAVKDYTPKVTALGTRGSNLHLIGQRMRTDYFFRWTRAPLRVMPGVEMPNYQKPHEFILPGQLEQQLIAIWQALNDPNLTSPTNPAVVEQLLTVGDDERARVVRDVFTVPGSTETVARAYAVGLPGGHSMLFDLERCSLRAWTLGDFAQQRCEGKRWYWDLAGTVIATGFDKRPEIILEDPKTGDIIAPETGWDYDCRLRSDLRDGNTAGFGYRITYSRNDVSHSVDLVDQFRAVKGTGWQRTLAIAPSPSPFSTSNSSKADPLKVLYRNAVPSGLHEAVQITVRQPTRSIPDVSATAVPFVPGLGLNSPLTGVIVDYRTSLQSANPTHNPERLLTSSAEAITTVPGFQGQRLPLPRSIMPTALTWDERGDLLFTSLKGHLFRLSSSTAAPTLITVEEGLAAPFGVITDPHFAYRHKEPGIMVAHKPELLRLDFDRKGMRRTVIATGWGITDDYHDWTCGIARDSKENLYIGLGSDYTFKNRPPAKSKWRGDILRIDPKGQIESIARGLRYPTGLAIDDQDRLFVTDQQGVQNTFNELDYIQVGHRYGVPSRHEPDPNAPADPPAVQIPHPWTRSVNGIVFVPKDADKLAPWAGQFIGCEMNNNMLVRMSIQTVGDVVQGAVYPFSKPGKEGDASNFVGPLCIGISPTHEVYVGGLQDGGWAGGLNVGDIVKLTPGKDVPNGIRELRATRSGFDIEFFHKVDPALAVQAGQYKISGYTRVWKGDYATPDSGHHSGDITSAAISTDGRTVSLTVAGRKSGHVYDVSIGDIGSESQRALWPALGHYTLHRIPE